MIFSFSCLGRESYTFPTIYIHIIIRFLVKITSRSGAAQRDGFYLLQRGQFLKKLLHPDNPFHLYPNKIGNLPYKSLILRFDCTKKFSFLQALSQKISIKPSFMRDTILLHKIQPYSCDKHSISPVKICFLFTSGGLLSGWGSPFEKKLSQK